MFAPTGLTPTHGFFLTWAALLVLLPLLRPALRHPALVISLPMLGASLAFVLLTGPLTALSENAFKSRAGDTLTLNAPLPARSIHIPDREALETPLYDCFANWPRHDCQLPIDRWFKDGLVDMVEIGSSPVLRITQAIHDPACDPEAIPDFGGAILSSGLGICLAATAVDEPSAALQLDVTPARMPFPSGTSYWRLTLSDRATGQALARRDHWIVPYEERGTDPTLPERTDSPRQPDDTLATLIELRFDRPSYDRDFDDRMLQTYGLDFDVLLRAASTGPQGQRAEAMYLACRNGVVATLSSVQRDALREATTNLFELEPNWRYPESCHPSLR